MIGVGSFFLACLGLIIIVATVLPLFPVHEWWVRIFDFPRVQILVIGAVVALGLGWRGFVSDNDLDIWVLIPLLVCLAYQGFRIHPYTRLAPKQSLDGTHRRPETLLRVFIANVYRDNRNAATFLELVGDSDPDIVLVIEPDQWWERQLSPLESSHPHTIKEPRENTYGMLLYSRFELRHAAVRFLIENSIPSIFTEIVLPSGVVVEFYGLHPRPPSFSQDTEERDAELLLVGQGAAYSTKPVLVAGDLNDVAWSHTTTKFQRISGLLDPRIGRGFYNTYHAAYPVFRFPVDHIFHSPVFRLVEIRRLARFGSDHFPILAVLAYEPEGQDHQRLPKTESNNPSGK